MFMGGKQMVCSAVLLGFDVVEDISQVGVLEWKLVGREEGKNWNTIRHNCAIGGVSSGGREGE